MLVCRLADLIGELTVVAEEVGWIDGKRLQGAAMREIEHLGEPDRDSPQLARQQIVDRQPLPISLTREFSNNAGPRCAQVDHREAVRRVEPTTKATRPITTSRIEPAHLFPIAGRRVRFTALALETSTASRGAIVIGVLPAATAVLATLRHGERPSWQFWLAATGGLVTVVVYTVLTGASGRPELADVFFLLAVASAAIGYAEGAALTSDLGGWQTISWALIIALPITLPIGVFSLAAHGLDSPGLSNWVGLAYVSLFSMYLGFFAWYAGLHAGGVARVSQIQLLQPMLTLMWSALLLNERVTVAGIVTAALVLMFVLASKRAGIRRAQHPTTPATSTRRT